MPGRMTKTEARAWMDRWTLVATRQREECVASSYAERFRALETLMASAPLFDFTSLDAEDEAARERWAALHEIFRTRR
jgi:hypothetical protein